MRNINKRAQSAMEYLMTYGWAILIIAIVLAALFSLNVFNSATFLGTECVSLTGYVCSSPLLHSGTFTASVGQATGTDWTSANIIFLESGAGTPAASSFALAGCVYTPAGGIPSGGTTAFSVANGVTGTSASSCNAITNTIGGTVTGSIWAYYSTASSTGLITELATVSLKGT